MENEEKVDVTTTDDGSEEIELDLDLEEKETPEASGKKDKPTETLEAREARLERQLAQTRKKMGKDTAKKEPAEASNPNDLGEKAYLIANGIKDADEIALTKRLSKETGKDVESLLATTYFQTELKDFRDKKATANATPNGSKRSSNSSVDTVEYWLAKGELPPASEVKLRQDVVNARMKKEASKGPFYNS